MQSKLRLLALGTLAALSTAFSVQAQCYEPLTGASIGVGDDTVLPIQGLGFAFPFNGTTYTDIHVSTNGFVYLSNAGAPAPGSALCCTGTTAALVGGSPKIAAYWSDLNIISGTGSVNYNALPGKAVITWTNAVEFGNTVQFSVQMQLLASGEIFFAYDGRCAIRTTGDFLVGMSEGGGAAVPAPSDFSTVGSSTSTTAFELFNNLALTYDLAGQTVQFVPTGLGYTWIPGQCASSNNSYGAGCYSVSDSLYSLYADAALASAALQGQSVQLIPAGGSYLASLGGGTYLAPSAAAVNLTAAPADDLEVVFTPSAPFNAPQGPQAQLRVHTNGIVSWGAVAQTFPGTNNYTPTAAGFLNGVNAGVYFWHDYNEAEAGSGRIKTEEVGGVLYITWDNVENYSTPTGVNPGTVQAQLDLASGQVTLVWPTVDTNTTSGFGSGHLVGYTGAGNSNDGGNVSLASLPVLIPGFNLSPLSLSAAGLPTPGSTITYTTSNMPEFVPTSGLYVGLHILSLGQIPAPGLDLGLVLGAPGCAALVTSIDLAQSMVGVSGSQSVSFTMPATAPLGLQLFAQSASLFTPGTLPNGQNAAGIITSNAIASTVGAW